MKASVFIKVALIDQMQQIADLGLWYNLAKLIPSGVELLARVAYLSNDDGIVFLPFRIEDVVKRFYTEYLPQYPVFPDSKGFFSRNPQIWLTSADFDKEKHLQAIQYGIRVTHYIHVPQWFDDFKTACGAVLDKIESGELEYIEVFKTLENDK